MIARTMFINLKLLRELPTVDKLFNRKQCMYAVLMLSLVVEVPL